MKAAGAIRYSNYDDISAVYYWLVAVKATYYAMNGSNEEATPCNSLVAATATSYTIVLEYGTESWPKKANFPD